MVWVEETSTTPNGVRQFENLFWMRHGTKKIWTSWFPEWDTAICVLIMRNQFMYIAYLLHIWMAWENRPAAQLSWTSWYQENLFPVFCKAIYVVVPAFQVWLLLSGIKFKAGRHSGLVKDNDWDTRDTWFKSCLGTVFPAVPLSTVNWKLVARNKGYMDAANRVSRHLCQWLWDLSTRPHRKAMHLRLGFTGC